MGFAPSPSTRSARILLFTLESAFRRFRLRSVCRRVSARLKMPQPRAATSDLESLRIVGSCCTKRRSGLCLRPLQIEMPPFGFSPRRRKRNGMRGIHLDVRFQRVALRSLVTRRPLSGCLSKLVPFRPRAAMRPLRSSRWPGSGDRYERSAVAAARSVIGCVRRMLAADEVLKNLYPSCHNKGCPPVRAMSVVGRMLPFRA